MYTLYDLEITKYSTKRVSIVGEATNLPDAIILIKYRLLTAASFKQAVHLQIILKEDTGVLCIIADFYCDFRPFAKTPDQMDINHFGYIKPF